MCHDDFPAGDPTALREEYEPFKTSSIFDATAQHPEWLGEEPERLQKLMPA
jgi:hypothetical protein